MPNPKNIAGNPITDADPLQVQMTGGFGQAAAAASVPVVIASDQSAVPVNSELPAAAALTGAGLANVAAPQVNAMLAALGGATVYPLNSANGSTDANAASLIGLVVANYTLAYNGAMWDRQRNNVEATALASAARTASTNSADITCHNGLRALAVLNVTAQPGGAETLSLKLQMKDPVSGGYIDVADAGVLFTAATGTKGLLVGPGVIAADLVSGFVGKSAAISRTFRYVVTHSSTGSWTYSLGYSLNV